MHNGIAFQPILVTIMIYLSVKGIGKDTQVANT